MAVMAPSMSALSGSIAVVATSIGLQAAHPQRQILRGSSSCSPRRHWCCGTRIGSDRNGIGAELRGNARRKVRFVGVRAEEEIGSAAGAGGDSVVSEVAVLEEEAETPGISSTVATKERKPGMLQRGGTLAGKEALGKDPGRATLGKTGAQSGAFEDPRWVKGTWDISTFTKDGKVNWDGVIDAEVKRRKWLEDNPEASSNSEPVLFETSTVPWWAWVKRFHLPEAELLNGRAAMVGYFAAYVVDSATGVGLVDQQNSFLGKLLLFITVLGILLIRKNEDLETLKTLAKESTFYDKQWQASWKEETKETDNPLE